MPCLPGATVHTTVGLVAGRQITAIGRTARWPYGRPFDPTAIRPYGHTASNTAIRPYGQTANITAIMAILGLLCIDGRNTDKIDKIRAYRTPHTVGASLPCGHLTNHKTQNQYFSIYITLTCT